MADKEEIAPQVTDAVSQSNVIALGHTPSFALAQSNLSFAQSQGVLFANMISDQQQQSTSGTAATVKCIQELLCEEVREESTSRDGRAALRSSSILSESSSETTTEKAEEEDNDPFFGKLDISFTGDTSHF